MLRDSVQAPRGRLAISGEVSQSSGDSGSCLPWPSEELMSLVTPRSGRPAGRIDMCT